MSFNTKPLVLVSAMSLAISPLAMAEEAESLEQVVVTATKTERSIDKVTANVQVITEDDIAKMGAVTLKDIFTKTPGLVLQYGTFPSGSAASKSSVNIRGVGATGSLWLIDGRRLSGEVKNPYDGDRIPASMIERIEIVKGPMSALYGADAVGGVINIITKQPADGFQAEVSAITGQNSEGDAGNTNLSANVRGTVGKFRGSFYVSSSQAEPYSEKETTNTVLPLYTLSNKVNPSVHDLKHDICSKTTTTCVKDIQDSYDVDVTYREESKVNTVGGRADYDVTDTVTLGAEFNWFEEERNGVYRGFFHPTGHFTPEDNKIPAFDLPVNSTDENERLDVAVDAIVDVNDYADIKFRVYRSYYEKNNSTTTKYPIDFGYATEEESNVSGMNATVEVMSYELSSNWQLTDNHFLTGGAEYRQEEREATVFSQSPDESDVREVAYTALYLQDDFIVNDQLSFTIGGRYDKYDQIGYTDEFDVKHSDKSDSETTFRMSGLYALAPMANLRFNVAQGYRVPDIRELYIQKQTPAGVQLGAQTVDSRYGKTAYDLKAERMLSYEIGLSGRSQKLAYSASVFYNDISDKIEMVNIKGKNASNQTKYYYTFQNLSDATTKGAELTLAYQLTDAIQTKVFWTELQTENEETGKELEFNPDRVISIALDWQINSQFRAGVDVTHTGEQYYTDDAGEDTNTDAYALTNITAGYSFGAKRQFDVFGGINNVLAETVDTKLGSNVGQYYYAGLKARF